MNPFFEFGNAYVPYRIYEQFSSMQQDLVNISYDATSVPSKTPLGRNLVNFCFVCSGTKKSGNLTPYHVVYPFNTYLGMFLIDHEHS